MRLVHQRILLDWARARTIVADSADFYRIRDDLEESRRKWETGKRRTELLLARGLPLAEAEALSANMAMSSRLRCEPMCAPPASAPIARS